VPTAATSTTAGSTTFHTVSFGDYYEPGEHVLVRSPGHQRRTGVRVATGFPLHPTKDMEIITYILEGALQHRAATATAPSLKP